MNCIEQLFSKASLDIKQYTNDYEIGKELIKEVEVVFEKLMEIDSSKSAEEVFIDKNIHVLARYCTLLLNKKYFPEVSGKENKYNVIKGFSEKRNVMIQSKEEEYQFKDLH